MTTPPVKVVLGDPPSTETESEAENSVWTNFVQDSPAEKKPSEDWAVPYIYVTSTSGKKKLEYINYTIHSQSNLPTVVAKKKSQITNISVSSGSGTGREFQSPSPSVPDPEENDGDANKVIRELLREYTLKATETMATYEAAMLRAMVAMMAATTLAMATMVFLMTYGNRVILAGDHAQKTTAFLLTSIFLASFFGLALAGLFRAITKQKSVILAKKQLERIIKIASQISEHMELQRLPEKIQLEMRLAEAEATLELIQDVGSSIILRLGRLPLLPQDAGQYRTATPRVRAAAGHSDRFSGHQPLPHRLARISAG